MKSFGPHQRKTFTPPEKTKWHPLNEVTSYMLLTTAIIVVVVLLAVALLPMKKREPNQLK